VRFGDVDVVPLADPRRAVPHQSCQGEPVHPAFGAAGAEGVPPAIELEWFQPRLADGLVMRLLDGDDVAGNTSGRNPSQWEPHLKTRVTGFGTNLNTSLVLLHNSLDGVEAEARALPNSFSGEKRFKDVRFYLGRNSGTVIADLDYDTSILAIDSDPKLTLSAHRVNGIVNNVGPDLIELTPKRIHEKGDALVIALHRHSLS